MKKIFDLTTAIICAVLFLIPILIIALAIRTTSKGPVLYWSRRVGKNGALYDMPKFRTMVIDTPEVASDLLSDPKQWYTAVGKFLRTTSLDELPQLWCIFKGEMSFVGPRPALYNQVELINMRDVCGVNELLPGITGWAQVNGRDEHSNEEKVFFDVQYLKNASIFFDIQIMILTINAVIFRRGVSH
jgi:O-antigen biosynthesis protein WbqP